MLNDYATLDSSLNAYIKRDFSRFITNLMNFADVYAHLFQVEFIKSTLFACSFSSIILDQIQLFFAISINN